MRRYGSWLFVVLCMLLTTLSVQAKPMEICVYITNDKEEILKDQSITLTNVANGHVKRFQSNRDGMICLSHLKQGEYRIHVEQATPYREKTVDFEVTAYNEHLPMNITIVLERERHTFSILDPSLLLCFFALLNVSLYMMIWALHQRTLLQFIDHFMI